LYPPSARDPWDVRYRGTPGAHAAAARVLLENRHLLPHRGCALDLACGLGANALLLARHGLDTHAWDSSPAAMERLDALAREQGLCIAAQVRDVVTHPPEPDSFDVIVVAHFLERALAPHIARALRPNGLLFYQTFTRCRVRDSGPRSAAYRLEDGELLRLFAGLCLRVYREEGRAGDVRQGFRDEAQLVAEKRL
jgi:tellurite methyltransferase